MPSRAEENKNVEETTANVSNHSIERTLPAGEETNLTVQEATSPYPRQMMPNNTEDVQAQLRENSSGPMTQQITAMGEELAQREPRYFPEVTETINPKRRQRFDDPDWFPSAKSRAKAKNQMRFECPNPLGDSEG